MPKKPMLFLNNKNCTTLCSFAAKATSIKYYLKHTYCSVSNTNLEDLIKLSKVYSKVKSNRSVLKRNVFVNLSYSSLIVEGCTGVSVNQICASMQKFFEEMNSIEETFYQLDLNIYLLRDGVTKVCSLEDKDISNFEKSLAEYNSMIKNLSTIFGLNTKDTSARDIISNNSYASLKGHSFRLNKKLNELTSCFIKIQQSISARVPEELNEDDLEIIKNFPNVYFSKKGKNIIIFTKIIPSTINKKLKVSDQDILLIQHKCNLHNV